VQTALSGHICLGAPRIPYRLQLQLPEPRTHPSRLTLESPLRYLTCSYRNFSFVTRSYQNAHQPT
jgi:hypothetical protein